MIRRCLKPRATLGYNKDSPAPTVPPSTSAQKPIYQILPSFPRVSASKPLAVARRLLMLPPLEAPELARQLVRCILAPHEQVALLHLPNRTTPVIVPSGETCAVYSPPPLWVHSLRVQHQVICLTSTVVIG
jgi:hypothetical protein